MPKIQKASKKISLTPLQTEMTPSGAEPTQVMKMGGSADFKTFKTFQIYVRMAGVDVKGVTDDFKVTPKFGSLDNVIRLKK